MDRRASSNIEPSWDLQQISDGGERASHLDDNYVYYAHLSIYDFAERYCQDALVLDAGSGAGYGAARLADAGARHVWGIDLSEKAITFSRHHFQRPNLTFDVMDLERIDGFDPQYFDFIFSSNTLEHVPDVIRFLNQTWNLLKTTGVFLVAVPPITDKRLQYLNLINPYHVNIWSPRQWLHVLSLFFEEIHCYLHGVEAIGADFKPEHLASSSKLTEKDFVFEQGDVRDMYEQFTLTAIFVAKRPRPATHLPAANAPLTFVDDSFTRPQGYISFEMHDRLKAYFDAPPDAPTWWSRTVLGKFSVRRMIGDAQLYLRRNLGLD